MTNPNDPAIPQITPVMDTNQGAAAYKIGDQFWQGLTKREYFAAMAMGSIVQNNMTPMDRIAIDAVKCADALIAELNK